MSSVSVSCTKLNWKITTVLSICLLTVMVALLFPSGGHISVDEGTYNLMARGFAETGKFVLWNGYEDFPSPELSFQVVHAHEGRLVSQYPDVYTLLATPFYFLWGYDGLFVLSALAFVGVVALTFWMARRLFGATELAVNACLILTLATFAWEYSQATMPHALSALFVAGSASLCVAAFTQAAQPRSLLLALGSGLVLGFGVGVRLDVIFAAPAMTVPYLFLRPWRPSHLLACTLGAVPGLALLAVFNLAKFGTFAPFSYGASQPIETEQLISYLIILAAGAAVLALVLFATSPSGRRLIHQRRRTFLLGLGLLLAAVLISPQGQALALRFADGLYQLLIDFRIRDLDLHQGGLSRGPSGGMIYLGGLKKSLLQSCPYLAALVVPLLALFRHRSEHRMSLAFLFLAPVGYVGVYSYFAWHGALAMNLRYFVPFLPFTSILAAYAWREISVGLEARQRRKLLFICLCLSLAYIVFIVPRPSALAEQEVILLTLPMMLAGALLVLLLLERFVQAEQRRILRRAAAAVFSVALTWSGVVAFTYDLPRSYLTRQSRAELTESIVPLIESDSLLFVPPSASLYRLFEYDRVRIATPHFDDFQSFEALLKFHLGVGRPVYAWLDKLLTEGLKEHGLWAHLRYVPLVDHERGRLVRIIGFADG